MEDLPPAGDVPASRSADAEHNGMQTPETTSSILSSVPNLDLERAALPPLTEELKSGSETSTSPNITLSSSIAHTGHVNGANGTHANEHVSMHNAAAIGTAQSTPNSNGRARGRGRGGGRPRGRGRGAGKTSKRRRNDSDDEDDSDSSVEVTPMATMTKSGRSVQKPTAFVPPPPREPTPTTTTTKRKKPFRRNLESAVCKVCLRGTSPASNMIVFCDGCNAPYHRYCHRPPIDQAVVDDVEREWYCKDCERQRIAELLATSVSSFVSAAGATEQQRRQYFSTLPSTLLINLLTRATTLHPDLPLFSTAFASSITTTSLPSQPTSTLPVPSTTIPSDIRMNTGDTSEEDEMHHVYRDQHPPHFPRPGAGLMATLPPDVTDARLVDDENDAKFGVFTHLYQTGIDNNGGGSGTG